MSTAQILVRIHKIIETCEGVGITSVVKTQPDQLRHITITFDIKPQEDHPLLDGEKTDESEK